MKFTAILLFVFIALLAFTNGELQSDTGMPPEHQVCKENLGECMSWCGEKVRVPNADCPSDMFCCVLIH